MSEIEFFKNELRLLEESAKKDDRAEFDATGIYPNPSSFVMQKRVTKDVLQLLNIFLLQEHSSFSAEYTSKLFRNLVMMKPLSPLTGNDDEWYEPDERMVQQNKRFTRVFRKNYDNSTAYNIYGLSFCDNDDDVWFSANESVTKVKFPYSDFVPKYIKLKYSVDDVSIKEQLHNHDYEVIK